MSKRSREPFQLPNAISVNETKQIEINPLDLAAGFEANSGAINEGDLPPLSMAVEITAKGTHSQTTSGKDV